MGTMTTTGEREYDSNNRILDSEDVNTVVLRKNSEGSRHKTWRRSMPAIFSGIKMKLTGSTNDLRKLNFNNSSTDSHEDDHHHHHHQQQQHLQPKLSAEPSYSSSTST